MSARTPRRRQQVFVGSKIRHLRKERNLTQSVLAQKIGVQQSDLCRMENGEYKVSLDTLFKILGVFDMEIGEFFRDANKPLGPSERGREVLRLFRRLDDLDQEEALEYLRYKYQRSQQRRDTRTVREG
jgi:transcriptional regulator with XRE-family HTH domain